MTTELAIKCDIADHFTINEGNAEVGKWGARLIIITTRAHQNKDLTKYSSTGIRK